ncbi:putative endopeptidase [Caulobacter ginsengisoli]|uniref:Endopeptidase n=1 Tax=Caulobacter ginsengisoli TaxID=400775 RepID=A0ABU0IWY6_9CAUL|nr:M13-type metalloendopeptidase [Caulobacter ginsengisoli]MDQ0466525.1 putative endopeptidase [Caulobacter ginsengisoli]
MKRLLFSAAAAAILACAGLSAAAVAADTAAASPAAMPSDLTKAPRMGTWGFDLAGRDLSVKPGDDFFKFANGTYMDKLVIPSDRTGWGSFNALRELSDARSRALIEKAASDPKASGEARQIGGLYASFMDEKTVEALGAKPLAAPLAAIKAAKTRDQIAELMGRSQGSFGYSFFGGGVGQDAKDTTKYSFYLGSSGLGLPDRDYYLTEQFAAKKAAYHAYVAQMLKLAGWPDADKQADAILAMEESIAKVSWTKVEERNPDKTYNPMTVAQVAKLAPGFNWTAFMKGAGVSDITNVVVAEPTAFTAIAKIYAETPIETLQAWQAFGVIDQSSPFLSKAFVDANFDFRAKTLNGQPEQRVRWKRGVALVGNQLGEAVGKVYVADYFPAESKAQMKTLVETLRTAMKGRIERLDWMTPATKEKALAKLAAFNVKIAYPDKWRDYSKLAIKDADLWGNVDRANRFEWDYQIHKLHGPVDRQEWGMYPQTVNAYYDPTMNEIVFPAAILQPPFFDPEADPAVNFGGIGAVIGHEMSHGFDDEGRKFAADGSLTDWWQPEDAAKFELQTKKLSALYSSFEPLPGAHVNGDLTMGENIGDLGGILVAYDAYKLSLGGKQAPVIDGLTGDQRFFLAFAQIWRAKTRDDALRQRLVSDPHSPDYYRVIGTLRNVDAWYAAWNIQPGDKMYVAPADRVRIW